MMRLKVVDRVVLTIYVCSGGNSAHTRSVGFLFSSTDPKATLE